MKKYFLSIVAATMIATTYAQIPNNGFENWTTVGSYELPTGWGTMNNATATNSVFTATKATPGSPGTSYLKLTSKMVGASVVKGIAVSGQLDTMTMLPKCGFAFTQRPASFTGKWQHMIYGSSQGSVKVLTTKWNTSTSRRDTVAHAEQTLSGMAMSWANFSMNMLYMDSLHYPDSCIIVLQSSGTNPTNNDYLWADNLAFTGTVAITVLDTASTVGLKEIRNSSSNLFLFPNPAHEFVQLTILLTQAETITLEMFDVTGKLVFLKKREESIGEVRERIDVKDFPKGTYMIKISGKEILEVKKVVVE